jgi:hypothetical protein
MPSRNYRKEYDSYHASATQKARRASRNRARYKLAKAGLVKKGDGREVDHINMNPMNNSTRNLKILPSTINRKKQPATKGRNKIK